MVNRFFLILNVNSLSLLHHPRHFSHAYNLKGMLVAPCTVPTLPYKRKHSPGYTRASKGRASLSKNQGICVVAGSSQ